LDAESYVTIYSSFDGAGVAELHAIYPSIGSIAFTIYRDVKDLREAQRD